MAEKYLENLCLVTDVRGMLGYTGTYQGKRLSIMGSGMGMPSIGIYSYELYTQYDVENIIRVGTAGGYSADAHVMDLMLVTSAYSESSFAKVQSGFEGCVTYPSKELNDRLRASAAKLGLPLLEGATHSSDVFYQQPEGGAGWLKARDEYGCLGVEMESFALFHNAAVLGKNAACLLTISNSLVTGEETTAAQREQGLTNMILTALSADY